MGNDYKKHILNILNDDFYMQIYMLKHCMDNHFREHILNNINMSYMQQLQLLIHSMGSHFREHILNILHVFKSCTNSYCFIPWTSIFMSIL